MMCCAAARSSEICASCKSFINTFIYTYALIIAVTLYYTFDGEDKENVGIMAR